jgi:hypothetical protein
MCDACSNQHGVRVVSEWVAVVCDDNDAQEIHLPSRASCLARIYTAAKKSDEKNSQMVNGTICWHYAIGASDPKLKFRPTGSGLYCLNKDVREQP